MKRRKFLQVATAATVATPLLGSSKGCTSDPGTRPNVLFISIDDLNDWIGCMDGYPSAKTPNIDRLAQQGCLFSNAYTPVPFCKPARGNIMTGMYPQNSGVFEGEYFRDLMPGVQTIPEHFIQNGYFAAGGGKLFHLSSGATEERDSWNEFDPFHRPPSQKRLVPSLSGLAELADADTLDWGTIDVPQKEFADWKIADWAISMLERRHDKPLFLGVGFRYPHLPWYLPADYPGIFPPEDVRLPQTDELDLADVPPYAHDLALENPFSGESPTDASDHTRIIESGAWASAIAAYLSAVSFTDTMLGRVMEAFEQSPYAENTIVVLWSDNGFHLGEKSHWRKFSLWDESTRVPLIVVAPGTTRPGSICPSPVSMVDLYPTLLELCNLKPTAHSLNGESLVPLLEDPTRGRSEPVFAAHRQGNYLIALDNWRYIRYETGSEELYDTSSDPNQWRNLAASPAYVSTKRRLKAYLPRS